MSNYRHIVFDLPTRCEKLLDACWQDAECQDAEVTLLLSLAEASIVIPFERLKAPCPPPAMTCPHCQQTLGLCPTCQKELRGFPLPHPSGDWERHGYASERLEELKTPFIRSLLWPDTSPGSWRYGTVELDSVENLEGVEGKAFTGKTAMSLLKHIRNALAHGNISTKAAVKDGRLQIGTLIFLSQPPGLSPGSKTWNFYSVTPEDFQKFFRNWLRFLQYIGIPECLVSDGNTEDALELPTPV